MLVYIYIKETWLTEQSVEVSVFAWHSDDDCVQPLLGPLLQTFQPGLIHFLRSLKLFHTAPRVTSPGEEEQSEPSDDYISLFLDDLFRKYVGIVTLKKTKEKKQKQSG